MEDIIATEPSSPPAMEMEGSTRVRACESCHKRKIRCDRRVPCSNCQSSKLSCRASTRRNIDQRPRSHVSSEHVKKINNLEEQLSNMQKVLQKMATESSKASLSQSRASSSTDFEVSVNTDVTAPSDSVIPSSADSPAFEGASSLSAHSQYAGRFLEEAVGRSSSAGVTMEITSALSALESLLNRNDHESAFHEPLFPFQRSREKSEEKAELPVMGDIITLLRWAKGPTPPSLLCFLPLITIGNLTELCKKVYFCTDGYSAAEFIIMNACLFFLLVEFCTTKLDKLQKETYLKHASLCRNNLETALGGLGLFIAPTLDNAKALVLGSMHALDISLPSMAWTLTSTAARICQSLGYHRSASMKDDKPAEAETKKAIFWYIYIMDKTLSLRLGRSSAIQEFDICLEMLSSSSDLKYHAWGNVWSLWIETATLHGWVYEQLYSPKALTQSQQERLNVVTRLASHTNAVQQKNAQLNQPGNQESHHGTYLDFVKEANEVVFLSLLTLIHRAAPRDTSTPASPFSKDCVETARAALKAHETCSSKYRDVDEHAWTVYIHWTILSCPFIPFMVIFCHAVTCLSIEEISRLERFVASLQPTEHTSEAGRKMHRLCHMFHRVGKIYVEERLQSFENVDVAANRWQTPDPYLNALRSVPGFPQLDDWSTMLQTGTQMGSPTEQASGDSRAMESSAELEQWFSGNQYIFGLLESDLSGITPP